MSAAAFVTLYEPDDGITYTVKQFDPNEEQDKEENHEPSKEIFDWNFGPIGNKGTLDTETFNIKITPMYTGILAGTLEGNLRWEELAIQVDYLTTKGKQRWYLKNGNELWTNINIKIVFNGRFEGDYKILVF